jgi:hypothetical protein
MNMSSKHNRRPEGILSQILRGFQHSLDQGTLSSVCYLQDLIRLPGISALFHFHFHHSRTRRKREGCLEAEQLVVTEITYLTLHTRSIYSI